MYNLDRDGLLDYLEFTINQCINVGSAYQKKKEIVRDFEICGARSVEFKLICEELKEKFSELEMTADQQRVELETLNSKPVPKEDEFF